MKIFEVYIPVIAFAIMFMVFVVQIFFRYFLNQPITWSYELTTIGFVWTVFLGAAYARHKNDHVEFTVFYDLVGERTKTLFRIAGNLLIAVAFIISIYPIYDYIQFLGIKKTSVLQIPFNIVFFPFLIFIVTIVLHSIYDLVLDTKKLISKEEL